MLRLSKFVAEIFAEQPLPIDQETDAAYRPSDLGPLSDTAPPPARSRVETEGGVLLPMIQATTRTPAEFYRARAFSAGGTGVLAHDALSFPNCPAKTPRRRACAPGDPGSA
jgi:hypothetical protein